MTDYEVSFQGDLVAEHPEPAGPPPGISEKEWAAVPPERKATVSYARTAKSESPTRGNRRVGWPRRIWLALAIANVWQCGADMAMHNWDAATGAVWLALACWWLSEFRISVIFRWLEGDR